MTKEERMRRFHILGYDRRELQERSRSIASTALEADAQYSVWN